MIRTGFSTTKFVPLCYEERRGLFMNAFGLELLCPSLLLQSVNADVCQQRHIRPPEDE